MARRRPEPETPPCYAMVFPGLEEVAADEITRDLGGNVRKTGRGFVVFRVPTLDKNILRLRTTEDVFLLAWGTDELTYRAVDLEKIDLVGLYDSYAAAEDAWRGAAQRSVDDAEMKYVVVHLHRLLEPDMEGISRPKA